MTPAMEPSPVPPPVQRNVPPAPVAPAVSSETDATMSVQPADTTGNELVPEEAPVEEKVTTKPLYSYKDYTPAHTMVYTYSASEVNDHLPLLKGPLGFDMEWKVSFRRRQAERATAVVQVCDRRYIWVIQVCFMRRGKSLSGVQHHRRRLNLFLVFPSALKKILEDSDVPKIGVNIRRGYSFIVRSYSMKEIHGWLTDDAKKLYKDFGIKMQNLVELSYMSRQADRNRRLGGKLHARKLISLQKLVGAYLDKHLSKEETRVGDWEVRLNKEQLECEHS